VADLALGDELGHRADGLLDRHLGVDAVLVVEVDRLDAEALQRRLAARADVLGVAADAENEPSSPRTLPNFVASTTSSRRPGDRAADELLVGERGRTCRPCRGR
jgi:hypothetical protein